MALDEQVSDFMKAKGVKKIVGFSGGSDSRKLNIARLVHDAVEIFAKYPVALLSGGTCSGMPLLAAQYAKEFSLPLIGVMPLRGEKYTVPFLDLKLVIEPRYSTSEWGDESEVFTKLADGVIYAGGRYGTLIEYAHTMKINQDRIRKNQQPVYTVLIQNTGSILESIPVLSDRGMSQCFPEKPIYTGKDAAEFVIKKLFRTEE